MNNIFLTDNAVYTVVQCRHIIIGFKPGTDQDQTDPPPQTHVQIIHFTDNIGKTLVLIKTFFNQHQLINMVFHFIQGGPGILYNFYIKTHLAQKGMNLALNFI